MLLQFGVYVCVCDYFGTRLHTYTLTHNTHTHTSQLTRPPAPPPQEGEEEDDEDSIKSDSCDQDFPIDVSFQKQQF